MSTEAIVVIVILVLLLVAWPSWPHSRGWGYGPTGILGAVLVVILIVWLVRHL